MRWRKSQEVIKHVKDVVVSKRRALWPVHCYHCEDVIWLERVRFVRTSFSQRIVYCYACAFTIKDFVELFMLEKVNGDPFTYVCNRRRMWRHDYYNVKRDGAVEFAFSL